MSTEAQADDRVFLDLARFMERYASTLDRGDLDAWVDLFAAESSYRVGSMENESGGLPLQLIDDRSKSKIEDRVRFIRNFWKGSFNEYLQRHILSLPGIVENRARRVSFHQSFAVYVTDSNYGGPQGGRTSLLCAGRYLGVATLEKEPKLAELRVILDTSLLAQSIVLPI